MSKGTVLIGNNFPEYCFSETIKGYIFFEFHFIFTDVFIGYLHKYLKYKNVTSIVIENIEPHQLVFKRVVSVSDFYDSFKKAVTDNVDREYIDAEMDFRMITDLADIYPNDQSGLFAIQLERGYNIAVLGVSDSSDLHFFEDYYIDSIDELLDFVSVNFDESKIPPQIEDKIREAWRFSVDPIIK